ncbi:MAG: polysaccharide deacetylase family protein [Chloroflexi bacterium]|nr:polysaccharide deacetylase family protein [Chloroflexota bacterium]
MAKRFIVAVGVGALLGALVGCSILGPQETAVPLPTPTTNSMFVEEASPAPPTPLPTLPPLITPEAVVSEDGETTVIPILLYHHVGAPTGNDGDYLSITIDAFRAHIEFLARNGYQTLNLDDLTLVLARQQEAPPKPVILTFDDGYRDQYENAVPILQEYGLTATFFITTELIESELDDYMTWEMIKSLVDAGMRVESQSSSDVPLAGLSRDAIMTEVRGAQATLAAQIGETPRYLAYPFGAYDETVVDALTTLGIAGALTTSGDSEHSISRRYEWGRIPVAGSWTLSALAERVRPVVVEDEPDVERGTAVIPIYDDKLHPNWTAHAHPETELSLEAVSYVHDGIYALSVIPLSDDGRQLSPGRSETTNLDDSQLFFRVRPETTEWYRRKQVVGVSFWLYSGMNKIVPGDLSLVVTGSNIQPYWAENDTSVSSNEILTFSGMLAYSLGVIRSVPRATWVQVDVSFDALTYDPDHDDEPVDEPEYEYVTGFYLISPRGGLQTIFIDEVELIMLAEEP